MLEQDYHRVQIPIHFFENETVEVVSANDGTTLIEILEEIVSEALLSQVSVGLTMYALCTITYVQSTSVFVISPMAWSRCCRVFTSLMVVNLASPGSEA